jgi:hypothetical protein
MPRPSCTAGHGGGSATATGGHCASNRFDIEIEEDLIEEVARIHGYDAIPEAPVTGEVAVGSAGGHGVSRDRLRQGAPSAAK